MYQMCWKAQSLMPAFQSNKSFWHFALATKRFHGTYPSHCAKQALFRQQQIDLQVQHEVLFLICFWPQTLIFCHYPTLKKPCEDTWQWSLSQDFVSDPPATKAREGKRIHYTPNMLDFCPPDWDEGNLVSTFSSCLKYWKFHTPLRCG